MTSELANFYSTQIICIRKALRSIFAVVKSFVMSRSAVLVFTLFASVFECLLSLEVDVDVFKSTYGVAC